MSTNSYIGILNPDKSVDMIYCHWDGYPEYNGRILKQYYNTEKKVRELLALGDLSVLDKEIGEKQDFDNPDRDKGWCLAYGRDRGESDTEAQRRVNVEHAKQGAHGDYLYIFDPATKKWSMYK